MATVTHQRGHRWFAATYDCINQWEERRVLGPIRERLLAGVTGRVLDLGAGTGANFRCLRTASEVVAAEPDPYMLERARKRARQMGLEVAFFPSPAEALPFADHSFDTVVTTLVLCTVTDPGRALAEARRVLKPGGTFRFVEHVRADGWKGHALDLVTPVWQQLGAGCHPNRRTGEAIRAAGFELVEFEERALGPIPLIAGIGRAPQTNHR
jgi:ubiquinone/menaquinone biosynthesis C-methylase UbiE